MATVKDVLSGVLSQTEGTTLAVEIDLSTASLAQGDALVAYVADDSGSALSVSDPGDWTDLGGPGSGATSLSTKLWTQIVGAVPPTAYTFSRAAGTTGDGIVLVAIVAPDEGEVLSIADFDVPDAADGTEHSVSVEGVAGSSLLLTFHANDSAFTVTTPPSGMTAVVDGTLSAFSLAVATYSESDPGTGTLTRTVEWSASEEMHSAAVLFAASSEDSTAPTLSNATATATGTTTATGSVDTDEAGTADAVLTTSATPPSATQIQAGQDHTGAAAAASDLGVAASVGTVGFSFSGLAASTTYYLHAVVEDAASNVSSVATSAGFQTDAPPNTSPTVTITAPTIGAIAVTAGTPLRFTATATDAEDGDLSAAIEWTSSNTDDGTGGDLGTGASIDVDTTGWSEDARTITATVADAALDEGSDSFTLTIGAAPAPSGGYFKALALVAPLGGY